MVLPHDPFVPTPDSPEWADPERRYENDTIFFKDMIAYVDKIVGRLESKLKEKNVWNNTLFIFTADNGTHPSVISATKTGKIKGAKGQSINTGNHVPMIVSWPGKIKEGRVFQGMVDFADFLPTLAGVAGIEPASYFTDGVSFLNVLNGENARTEKEEIFIHYSPRWGRFTHNRWVMNENYKLYRDGSFYQTSADPMENNPVSNLSESEQKLKNKFEAIIHKMENEIPFELNDTAFVIQK
jgi:arylsulfatase A